MDYSTMPVFSPQGRIAVGLLLFSIFAAGAAVGWLAHAHL